MIWIMYAAGMCVGGAITAGLIKVIYGGTTEPAAEKVRKPKHLWEVQTKHGHGYVTLDKDGKEVGARHDVVVIECVRQNDSSEDDWYSGRSSRVEIGAVSVKDNDLAKRVAEFVEIAEARCVDMNALEVR